jgi:alpha-tubulin suppressor-like RCC1 family protein
MGHTTAMGIASDGTLWAWGDNGDGQHGTGPADPNIDCQNNTPLLVSSERWSTVALGSWSSGGIKADGTQWAWGLNAPRTAGAGFSGRLGLPVSRPRALAWSLPWGTVATTNETTLATTSDLTAWVWGRAGANIGVAPVATNDLETPTVIQAADGGALPFSAMVLNASGSALGIGQRTIYDTTADSLWGWGTNASGELGLGNLSRPTLPEQSDGGVAWKQLALGQEHAAAISGAGDLYVWGGNGNKQLGGCTPTVPNSPCKVTMQPPQSWKSVAAGAFHTLAVTQSGRLFAWGDHSHGQLGLGTLGLNTCTGTVSGPCAAAPFQVGADTQWVAVFAAGSHSLGLKSDGTLWAWGDNTSGQLGVVAPDVCAATNCAKTPTLVSADGSWLTASTSSSIELATGRALAHTLAVKTDGSLWSWGDDTYGQLGDGANEPRTAPVRVGTANTWRSVAAGDNSSHALRIDGSLWTWGDVEMAQYGDGDTKRPRLVP